jgi:hypothetical protein
LIASESEHG